MDKAKAPQVAIKTVTVHTFASIEARDEWIANNCPLTLDEAQREQLTGGGQVHFEYKDDTAAVEAVTTIATV